MHESPRRVKCGALGPPDLTWGASGLGSYCQDPRIKIFRVGCGFGALVGSCGESAGFEAGSGADEGDEVQVAQQRGARPGHRGPDRQLHRPEAQAGRAQAARGQPGEALYLRGEFRLERRAEPLTSPAAGRDRGRASQIASLTTFRRTCSAPGPRRV